MERVIYTLLEWVRTCPFLKKLVCKNKIKKNLGVRLLKELLLQRIYFFFIYIAISCTTYEKAYCFDKLFFINVGLKRNIFILVIGETEKEFKGIILNIKLNMKSKKKKN